MGEQISQAAQFSRPTQIVALPDELPLISLYPKRLRGGYSLTVREGATAQEVRALLPDKLPIELQIIQSSSEIITATGEGAVTWNLPENLSPGHDRVDNAVHGLQLPESFQIETFYEVYSLERPIIPMHPLVLRLNWVTADAKAQLALHQENAGMGNNYPAGMLYVDFPLKPSGARAIIPSYSLDGGKTWVQTADLLSYNEGVDAMPQNADYRFVALFSPEQSPYREYLAGETDGFLVRMDITGGSLQGRSEVAKWPMDYEPPIKDGGDEGSGGNENNSGSGGGAGAGSGANGGQRPELPPTELPHAAVLPPELPENVPQEKPIVPPTPTPTPTTALPTPTPSAEPSAAPIDESPEAPEQTPGALIASETPSDSGAVGSGAHTPPPAETHVPAAPPEVPSAPHEKEKPPVTAGSKAALLPITERHPAHIEETPREASGAAATPMAAAGVLLIGGGAVAVCSGGGSGGLAHTGRRLLAAIKRLLQHSK